MNNQVNIDLSEDAVAGAFGHGIDYFMANEAERKKIAANATTLQKEEWQTLSSTMVQEYRRNAYALEHLISAGLTRNISLATKVDLWQTRGGVTDPEVSMDGESRSDEDRITYDIEGVPVPIIHKDFRIGDRDLQTSRRMGNDLQTDTVAEATEVVTKKSDNMVFDGWEGQVAEQNQSFQLYGYTSHPDRNQLGSADMSDWGASGGNIRTDFVSILDVLDENNRDQGGFWFYLAPDLWRTYRSQTDDTGDGNRLMRSRIEDEFSQEIGAVYRAHDLPDGTIVAVDPRPDVVEVALAEDTQLIEWQSGSGMTHHFKVMRAFAPELKSDIDGQSGIVHATDVTA